MKSYKKQADTDLLVNHITFIGKKYDAFFSGIALHSLSARKSIRKKRKGSGFLRLKPDSF